MSAEDESLRTAERPPLTRHQREEVENRLLEERKRAQDDLNQALSEEEQTQADSSGGDSHLPSHLADVASHSDEADTDFRLAERDSERVSLIDSALRRLRRRPEAFGVCQSCGEAIQMERLRVIPWTLYCADHAPGD